MCTEARAPYADDCSDIWLKDLQGKDTQRCDYVVGRVEWFYSNRREEGLLGQDEALGQTN